MQIQDKLDNGLLKREELLFIALRKLLKLRRKWRRWCVCVCQELPMSSEC